MRSGKFVILTFEPYGIRSRVKKGTLLLDALKSAELEVRSDCGGRGICGKCKVIIKNPSKLVSIVKTEEERLSPSELKSGYRLACCSKAIYDTTIFIPEESRAGGRKFLIEGTERPVVADSAVRKCFVVLEKPSISDARSDTSRLNDFLKETYGLEICGIDHQLQKKLSETLRKAGWKATVTLSADNEIISVESGDTSDEIYGVAVDIGTSKIIAYLSNLITGGLISTASLENPQLIHGEDVISRIAYASEGEAELREMQKLAVEGVNAVIRQACRISKCNPERIYDITVVCNTAMHHFFLGISPKHLGVSPYVPAVSDPINIKAKDLSIDVNPNANIHLLPVIAGFVGSDAVADIISTETYRSNKLSLAIDIGTNTEIILGDRHGMAACSCASGPAFEGAHIKCGMKAVAGAIEKLRIRPRSFGVKYQTVGDVKPIGICGSGIIDAVANLLRLQLIDRSGMFTKNIRTSRLRVRDGLKEFVLVSSVEGAKHDVVISQKDIEQVQLAKAAIYAGCRILMKTKGVDVQDVKKMFVAGAFGNYINIDNAKLIGMLPNIPTKNIRFVGNAAGAGARMALISRKHRRAESLIQRKMQYVELALDPGFPKEFSSAMFFPEQKPDRV